MTVEYTLEATFIHTVMSNLVIEVTPKLVSIGLHALSERLVFWFVGQTHHVLLRPILFVKCMDHLEIACNWL